MKILRSILVASCCLPIFAQAENPQVLMKTSEGEIVVELNAEKAPITVKNFLSYVDAKHYNGTVFHRVIKDFMVQGGGFSLRGGIPTEKDTQKPIKNERDNGLTNEEYTLAMARTTDVDSATSQFFINTKDNGFLNYDENNLASGYAVFGKVIKGQEVVDKIEQVETAEGKLQMRHPSGQLMISPAKDVPTKPVVIESITRLAKKIEVEAEPEAEAADKTETAETTSASENGEEKAAE